MSAEAPTSRSLPAPSEAVVALRRNLNILGTFIRELFSNPFSAIGTIIVVFFVILALFGPMIAPYSRNDQSSDPNLTVEVEHPFGTDYLGRDVYSRVILGTGSVLLNAGLGSLIAVVLGTFIGLYIGYQGGTVDEIISRIIDALLALPPLLIALVALGVIRNLDLQQGTLVYFLAENSVLIVISLVYVPIVARVVRSSTLDIKTREFVLSAQTRGESTLYIMFREIFPSVIPTLVVEASLRFSYAIFLVASLGFLGVGVRPPTPDWGLMVNEGRRWFSVAPWQLTYPAAAIAILVVGVNLMSDGIKRIVQKSE